VVQNGFGDVIRIGDGDEVRDVPHPPPGSKRSTISGWRDSMELRLRSRPAVASTSSTSPEAHRPLRLVGSVFVDRTNRRISCV